MQHFPLPLFFFSSQKAIKTNKTIFQSQYVQLLLRVWGKGGLGEFLFQIFPLYSHISENAETISILVSANRSTKGWAAIWELYKTGIKIMYWMIWIGMCCWWVYGAFLWAHLAPATIVTGVIGIRAWTLTFLASHLATWSLAVNRLIKEWKLTKYLFNVVTLRERTKGDHPSPSLAWGPWHEVLL